MKFAAYVLLLIPGLAPAAPALWPAQLSCQANGKIKYIYKGEEKMEVAGYCFSADHSYLLSPGCQNQPCAALSGSLPKIPDSDLAGSLGSPGFKLCRKVGGEPQLLEYFDGEKWWSADRCLFARDGSFVDTGILVKKRSLGGKD